MDDIKLFMEHSAIQCEKFVVRIWEARTATVMENWSFGMIGMGESIKEAINDNFLVYKRKYSARRPKMTKLVNEYRIIKSCHVTFEHNGLQESLLYSQVSLQAFGKYQENLKLHLFH
ncbi:6458_t:CDS:2 [Funneliformis caledonium]|uniref:6458_t:CDS:1 n=1 Tax=Funneliformis caledonium TaxID=1117310 RepID=A0A9N9HF53_9GLOM|nr:6458_t:CDS:2 [Funneliformis caledonium]